MENSSESEVKSDLPEVNPQPYNSPPTYATSFVNDHSACPPPSCNAHPNYHMDSRHTHATSYGHPYYEHPQPDPGYTGSVFIDVQGCQQQQQQMPYMVTQTSIVVASQPVPSVSMTGAIVLSCLVYFFCGVVCGGIAFILAMSGQSSAAAGDIYGAIQMRRASYGLSLAGIVTGIIAIIIIVACFASAAASLSRKYS